MLNGPTKIHRRISLFVFALATLSACSLIPLEGNQMPDIPLEMVWEKTLEDGTVEDLLVLPDGGFVLAGRVRKEERYEWDVLVVRFSKDGDILWQRKFDIDTDRRFQIDPGGSTSTGGSEYAHSIKRLDDGGFIVAGSSGPRMFTPKVWLMRLDANGDQLWLNQYGGISADIGAMAVLPDGSIIIGGDKLVNYPAVYGEGVDSDAWLARVNSDGEIIWDRTYDEEVGADTSTVSSITLLPNGYMYATMKLSSDPNPHRRVKLDMDGRVVEQDALSAPDRAWVSAALAMPKEGLVVAFWSSDEAPSISMMDAAGETLWETTFPDEDEYRFSLEALTKLSDKLIALTIGYYKNVETNESSGAIIFFDDEGETLGTHFFQDDHYSANKFKVLPDGSYISAGRVMLKKEHPEDDIETSLWLQKLSSKQH